jgi:predicted lipid-binding transport protein (Tim44 family)
MERRETAVEAVPETTAAAPRSRLRWKTYAGIAAILLLIVLILAFSRSRTTSPVEATKPQPAPFAAPPPSPLPQPASGSVQDAQPQSPARPASVAGAAGATPAKAKPNSAAQRRKAALQALDGAGKKTDQGRDRRSSSLDALKQ